MLFEERSRSVGGINLKCNLSFDYGLREEQERSVLRSGRRNYSHAIFSIKSASSEAMNSANKRPAR